MLLLRYFLKQFIFRFCLFFLGLVPLFASCDMIIRLATVPFSFHIMKLLWFMLPLICMFAVPIASCLAVGTTIGNIFARDELLMFRFFPQARKKIQTAVLLFSGMLALIFIPIVFQWAPQGYWHGKRFLIRTMHLQIESLPPQKFHQIASRCTIFFKEKSTTKEGNTRFDDILLMVREKNNKQYLVAAKYGVLHQGELELFEGTIYNNDEKSHYIATFKSLEIAFERMFFDAENEIQKPVKFSTFRELQQRFVNLSEEGKVRKCTQNSTSQKKIEQPPSKEFNSQNQEPTYHAEQQQRTQESIWREIHKRLAQILWQLLLPILIFFAMMFLGKQKSNLLPSVVVSGSLFLISYISLNMAYFLLQPTWIIPLAGWMSLSFYYGFPIMMTIIFWAGYRKRWG